MISDGKRDKASIGGMATATGVDYEQKLAAFCYVHLAVGTSAERFGGEPKKLERVWMQAPVKVGDVVLIDEDGGAIYIQAKYRSKRFSFSSAPNSEFSETISNFAIQFLSKPADITEAYPWEREFNSRRDRFLLAVPSTAGKEASQYEKVIDKLLEAKAWTAPNPYLEPSELLIYSKLKTTAENSLRHAGAECDPALLHDFVSAIRIRIYDLEDQGPCVAEVKRALHTQLLSRSTDAPRIAWSALLDYARSSNCMGLSVSARDVQVYLLSKDVPIDGFLAYKGDVEKLRRRSERAASRISKYSTINLPSGQVKIPRHCLPNLEKAVGTNLVIIGGPGSGKSGLLFQLYNQLKESDRVLLLADELTLGPETTVRDALDLRHDLASVLATWDGPGQAYLIVDALDAVRDSFAQRRLQDTIRDVITHAPRWKVIASIRRFDLKYSGDIRDNFPGSGVIGYEDEEFKEVAHFRVPPLCKEEIKDAATTSPLLNAIVAEAAKSTEEWEIFVHPYNLYLISELLRIGRSIAEIFPLTGSESLPEKYWSRRLLDSPTQGALREQLLTSLTNRMADRLEMSARRDDFLGALNVSNDLAIIGVLDEKEYERGVLRYSHHLLHDYAFARLILRPVRAAELAAKIISQQRLLIYARQSLVIHLDYIWLRNPSREEFWHTAIKIAQEKSHPIAVMLCAECAANRIREYPDILILVSRLSDPASYDSALRLLRYTIGEFFDCRADGQKTKEANQRITSLGETLAKVAVELIEKFPDLYWEVHQILFRLLDLEKPPQSTREPISRAALHLAKLRIVVESVDERFSPPLLTAIRSLCRTVDVDPAAVETTLLPLLNDDFAATDGDRVYWTLADEVQHIIDSIPEFVGKLYRVVFGNKFVGQGERPLGGKIVPMSFQRKDDYSLAQNTLADAFPNFAERRPLEATNAVLETLPLYIAREHSIHRDEHQFTFDGAKCVLLTDYSSLWAREGRGRSDDFLRILHATWGSWAKLSGDERANIESIIEKIRTNARHAVAWAGLLEAGTVAPETLGRRISRLLTQSAILNGLDTHYHAIKLFKAVFPSLPNTEKEIIEKAILESKAPDTDDRLQSHYLTAVNESQFVSAEAKALAHQLRIKYGERKSVPPFETSTSTSEITWEDRLEEVSRIELQTLTHKEARTHQERLESLKKASPEGVKATVSYIKLVYPFAVSSPPHDLNPIVARRIWAAIVDLVGSVVQDGRISEADTDDREFLKSLLLKSVTDPSPEVGPETEDSFAESPSWSSPSVRVEAAEALVVWGKETGTIDDDVRLAIRTLARDSHPAVRFQIAGRCNACYDVDRVLMLELVSEFAKTEANIGVWEGLLGVIGRVSSTYPEHAYDICLQFLNSKRGKRARRKDVGLSAISIIGALYLRNNEPRAGEYIFSLLEDPTKNTDSIAQLSQDFRDPLAVGLSPGASDFHRNINEKAFTFVDKAVKSLGLALNGLLTRSPPVDAEDRKQWEKGVRDLLTTLDSISSQIYFASGAYEGKTQSKERDVEFPPKQAFWRRSSNTIRHLAEIGSSHISYHLAETLEYLVPANPPEIFSAMALLVSRGKVDGFQREHLAVGVISRVIELYLAQYRDIFRDDNRFSELLAILETFAEIGWPETRRAIRNLSSLFR